MARDPRTHAIRQDHAEPVRAHCVRPSTTRPRRRGRVFRAKCLRRRVSGLPWPIQVGRRIREVPERRQRRVRDLRLDSQAAVVQRQDWHDGSLVRRAHAGSVGFRGRAGRRRDVSRLRRIFQRVSGRHPAGRRVRAQAGDVGVQQRDREPRPAQEIGHAQTFASGALQLGDN